MTEKKSKITVVLTRGSGQSKETAEMLEGRGFKVIQFPTIKISPVQDYSEFDKAVDQLADYDYLIFTSGNTVKVFSERLKSRNKKLDQGNTLVAAVGEKTAKMCNKYDIKVDMLPDEFTAEGIAGKLGSLGIKNKKVFLPGSAISRKELRLELESLGAEVEFIPVYAVTIPESADIKENIEELKASAPDLFIFTSPSTFNNFLKIMQIDEPESYFRNIPLAAIGPVTEQAIKDKRLPVAIVPEKFTMESLADSIQNFFAEYTVKYSK